MMGTKSHTCGNCAYFNAYSDAAGTGSCHAPLPKVVHDLDDLLEEHMITMISLTSVLQTRASAIADGPGGDCCEMWTAKE